MSTPFPSMGHANTQNRQYLPLPSTSEAQQKSGMSSGTK